MSKQKTIKADFVKLLEKAINDRFTGRLVFMGPDGGVVRVILYEGKLKHVDSTWGYGKNELEKLRIWKVGTCIVKALSDEDKQQFKDLPNIDVPWMAKEEASTETGNIQTPKIEVPSSKTTRMLPYRILDGGAYTLEELVDEISQENLSGYIKVKPSDKILLFYKGRVIGAYSSFPPFKPLKNYELINAIHSPQNQILFYKLDDPQSIAFTTLYVHKTLMSNAPAEQFPIEDILQEAKENEFTGDIWINGELRILIYFINGEIEFISKLDDIWRYIPLPKNIDLRYSRIYKYQQLSEEEIISKGMKIVDEEDFQDFLKSWQKLNADIIGKVGKKLVHRTLQAILENEEFAKYFEVENGMLRIKSFDKSKYILMEYLLEITSRAVSKFKTFVGGTWMEERIKKFYREEKELIRSLGLDEVLRKLWEVQ